MTIISIFKTVRFSVIIPTCNRNELLGLCLNRLAPGKQTLSATDYEVIVSDDGQYYPAESYCRENFPWVRYTRGPRKGPAANRNNGAKMAKAEWLAFTDDDCLPDPGWLKAYRDAITSHPDCRAFEGAILPDDWNLLKKDMAECPVNTEGGCFWSANIALQKELFFSIGGFDEQFLLAAHEDQEIYDRLKKLTKIAFAKEASIIHPVRFVSLLFKIKRMPISFENFKKYLNTLDENHKRLRKIKSRGNHFKSIFKNLISGKPKSAIYHCFALCWYLKLIK